jgi:hypothetical protein
VGPTPGPTVCAVEAREGRGFWEPSNPGAVPPPALLCWPTQERRPTVLANTRETPDCALVPFPVAGGPMVLSRAYCTLYPAGGPPDGGSAHARRTEEGEAASTRMPFAHCREGSSPRPP